MSPFDYKTTKFTKKLDKFKKIFVIFKIIIKVYIQLQEHPYFLSEYKKSKMKSN